MDEIKKGTSNKKGKIVLIVIAVVLVIGIFGTIFDDSSKNETDKKEVKEETKVEEKKELSESQKMIVKITDLMEEKLVFDTGDYVKGEIPSGEYAFIKFDGSGSYYSEEDAGGNIIDNENFDSFGYVKVHGAGNLTTRGVLININAFEKLGVESAKQIYETINEQENYNQAGYYKIGVDIPAGKYTVESLGSGYYAIMTGPVGDSDIVNNDNFNGKKEFIVNNGQYLNLSRATLSQ
ncbi:MAG: hypothetical protein HFH46_01040 [Bacilli bacterium]|nr:hypothetical protein [Bacilli bacterium]MCI9585043.1 hypothetical protein [Bacilli bacterium]